MKIPTLINSSLLWEKIKDYAKKAGRVSTRPVLLLYYVMKSPDTPKSDKLLIVSTLAYLVFPIDFISAKKLPIIGWIDEIAAVAAACEKVSKHITPEIESEVDNILERWFPQLKYELIVD